MVLRTNQHSNDSISILNLKCTHRIMDFRVRKDGSFELSSGLYFIDDILEAQGGKVTP